MENKKESKKLNHRETQMQRWEAKNNACFKTLYPNLWKDYLLLKDK